jgi:long-subunit fatty acid transport protein
MNKRILFVLLAFIGFISPAMAQKVAVKTNLLYDATSTINLGTEFGLSPKWTLDVSANYNPWTYSNNKKWKHWLVQPEARYWFCNKMMGHFIGFHTIAGSYNIGNVNAVFKFLGTDFSKLKDYRYEGWFVGAGVAYGYSWVLSKHWNLEAELGIGYTYSKSDKFECASCGEKMEDDKTHHYVGPTKAALNLVYVF